MTVISPLSTSVPFRRQEGAFGALGADVAARAVAEASDIALLIDRDGVVRDLSISSAELLRQGFQDWLDRPWVDAVAADSRHKIAPFLQEAAEGKPARWREINHPSRDGGALLVRYLAMDAGDDNVIVVGRDLHSISLLQERLLQTQQSVERDYLRLRQTESRYRLLFQTAPEAVLILDAATGKIREANPAVGRLTGVNEAAMAGQAFTGLLDPDSVGAAMAMLNTVTGAAPPAPVPVRLADGTRCLLSASVFRQDRASLLLARLMPADTASAATDPHAVLRAVVERISDAFVVTDSDLNILAVNPAFLDLTHLSSRDEALTGTLERYLGRPQIDLKIMVSQLREHGSLRNFSTVVRGVYGETEEVEVSAVSVPDGDQTGYGFSIRGVARRPATPLPGVGAEPRTVEQLTQLIGRVPMKDIVRESTDLIERLCIEAALTLTSDNRASAADLLGLSRQSLYSKLRRYGLGNLEDADE